MSLPTQCELLRRVREAAFAAIPDSSERFAMAGGPVAMDEERKEAITTPQAGGNTADKWAELLPLEHNWHKAVYTLQIIDALLLPAPVRIWRLWTV